MPRPIKWKGLKNPNYDLSTKRPSGEWGIMHSDREGWIIKPPLYWKTFRDEYRTVAGHVDRDIARLQAETMIHVEEKWPRGKS